MDPVSDVVKQFGQRTVIPNSPFSSAPVMPPQPSVTMANAAPVGPAGAGADAVAAQRAAMGAAPRAAFGAAAAEAAPAAAAAAPEAGFLSRLVTPGAKLLPDLGIMSGLGTAAKTAARYTPAATAIYGAARPIVDVVNGTTGQSPGFQEYNKWMGAAGDRFHEGSYGNAAGDAALGFGSTFANVLLDMVPGYRNLYNGLPGGGGDGGARVADAGSGKQQSMGQQPAAAASKLPHIDDLPNIRFNQLKHLAPFIQKPLQVEQTVAAQLQNALNQNLQEAMKSPDRTVHDKAAENWWKGMIGILGARPQAYYGNGG